MSSSRRESLQLRGRWRAYTSRKHLLTMFFLHARSRQVVAKSLFSSRQAFIGRRSTSEARRFQTDWQPHRSPAKTTTPSSQNQHESSRAVFSTDAFHYSPDPWVAPSVSSKTMKWQTTSPVKHVVSTALVVDGGKGVELRFRKGNETQEEFSLFHTPWLWSNDPGYIHQTSGQRTRSPTTSLAYKITSASIHLSCEVATALRPPQGSYHPVGTVYQLEHHDSDKPGEESRSQDSGMLRVEWQNIFTKETSVSMFDLDWLLQFRYDDRELQRRFEASRVTKQTCLNRGDQLHQVDFWRLHSAQDQESTRLELLDAIIRDGAALVKNAPSHISTVSPEHGTKAEETVGVLGKSLSGGALSHGSLYGDVFHVQNEPGATNVASTNLPLPPHHDMAYYESKPGLQLLHCVNNRGVSGGSSTLIDALAAAESLREIQPQLFQTLTSCEATFVKQRKDADMAYRRPHIEQDSQGSVVRVTWSPPFEGPLCVEPDSVEDYYVAYAAFERLLDNSLPANASLLPPPLSHSIEQQLVSHAHEFTWDGRLEIGDILVFNNHRMLHGRRAFQISNHSKENGRHLIGCYTNMDDTLNQYRLLKRKVKEVDTYAHVTGNGSSSIM